ncbi:MAG: glycosyltransferase [Solirubrobacterales bacterium]|nr:glycosyltransferase [Solirubrobacterales bacterium]
MLNELRDGLPIKLTPAEVNTALTQAQVGLCLSRVEGARYATMEYLLAGLPVVSTPSFGGREVWLDADYSIVCDADPEAVADAVTRLACRDIPREEVRARTLERAEPARQEFLVVLEELRNRLDGAPSGSSSWPPDGLHEPPAWDELETHLDRLDESRTWESRSAVTTDAMVAPLLQAAGNVQLTSGEIRPIAQAIHARQGCALLVFGCGNDSVLWEELNATGTTVFLEDDEEWVARIRKRLRRSTVHQITYTTSLSDWRSVLEHPPPLRLPADVASGRYDVILVDGPAGDPNHRLRTGVEAPGRMQSIATAAQLVAEGGVVFVHDCDRDVEAAFATRCLGDHRLFVETEGRALLRGYGF